MTSKFVFLLSFIISRSIYVTSDEGEVNVAVVEYHHVTSTNGNSDDTLILNVENYISIMEGIKDGDENVDLIIFPEATLNSGVDMLDFATLVRIGENPCIDSENTTYPNYIQKLSCSARKFSTNLVINTREKEPCSEYDLKEENCKNYGHLLYNTDIIFDTDGNIAQRYRKRNLFGEHPLNTPDVTDNVTFSVNSVEFGVFTCFDMTFRHPAQDLVEAGVKNFVYPSMWYAELPFLTALQTQQMWAMAHGVNLYAAGASNPSRGSGGSSIINGTSGPIVMDIVSEGGSKAYTKDSVTDDDIDSLSKSMDSFLLRTDNNLTDYTSYPLDNLSSVLDERLCHGELCCTFHIETSHFDDETPSAEKNSYVYHLIAYTGLRSFQGMYKGGIEVCGLAACLNSSISSCGLRFPKYDSIKWDTTFEKISIVLESTASADKIHFANSLLSSIRPLPPSETTWSVTTAQDESTVQVDFGFDKPQNRLLSFAIYGRNFALD